MSAERPFATVPIAVAERPKPIASAAAPRVRAFWRPSRQGSIVLGLVALAVAIRVPYLWQVPRFTDELQEMLWALAIYRGEILPLTAVDSYYGPLWSYLLAGAFRLGADPETSPRLIAMLLAAGTVGLTYLVGRDMADHRAGLIAAALLATSGGHVIINSHTARSNSVTPLITTLGVWLLYRAVRSGSGWPLAASGLLFGLALQTHLSAIALAPGLAVGLLLLRPRLLTGRWAILAAALGVLAYANMIVFNVQNGFQSVMHARNLQQAYTDGRGTDLVTYAENMAALVQSLSRLLSGTIETAASPARFVYVGLALAGLALAARRANPLPMLVCASMALVLPYFNPRYGPILSGRYLIPMLPFAYLGIALAVLWVGERVVRHWPRASAVRWAMPLVFVLFPLAALVGYYGEVLADGRVNRPLFALADAVESGRRPNEPVLLDEATAQEALGAGGTDLKALRFLFEARAIPYEVAKITSDTLGPFDLTTPTVVTLMDAKKRQTFARRFEVTPLSSEIESASGSDRRYAVYRLTPRAGQVSR